MLPCKLLLFIPLLFLHADLSREGIEEECSNRKLHGCLCVLVLVCEFVEIVSI